MQFYVFFSKTKLWTDINLCYSIITNINIYEICIVSSGGAKPMLEIGLRGSMLDTI